MITVLCGGVGGSRFLRALRSDVAPERVTAIINTGDDDWFHGLYVSPDPDIVTYALAGEVDEERGWGLRGDTFRWLESLRRFGHETWFQIGDRDLATHLHRTRLLHEGVPLSQITAEVARAFGVRARLLPMSDDRVRTIVETSDGDLSFQEFLVKRHAQDRVLGMRYEGADVAKPAPGVLDAIRSAEAIFIAPSNAYGSILPILAIRPIRETLRGVRRGPCIAISPIIGGRSLQPPAAEMMAGHGYSVDVAAVASIYDDYINSLIIDEVDASRVPSLEEFDLGVVVTNTIMRDDASRRSLALAALEAAGIEP